MAPLTANFLRPHKVHQRATNDAPANAGEKFYTGGYALRESGTGVATKVVAAGNVPLGVIVEPLTSDDPLRDADCHLDNTSGADGSIDGNGSYLRCVRYDQVGEYAFAISTGTPKVGGTAYLVDDNTVSPVDPGSGVIAGRFTRPCETSQIDGGWFVDIANAAELQAGIAADAGALAGPLLFTGGDAGGDVALRFGGSDTEGLELQVIEETLALTGASVNLTSTVPSGAVIVGVQGNVEVLAVAGGTSVKVGLGVTADPDKYGKTASLVKNQKIDVIPDWAVLSGAEQIAAFAVTTAGAAGDTVFSAGSLRVRVYYLALNSLDNAA